ncbi:MAG: caspase family protein, partial [Bacteroidetes bacterium]|nr:caspase family protein [Bacteroidota bacterium]
MRKVLSQTFIFLFCSLLLTDITNAQTFASNYSTKSSKHKNTFAPAEDREDIAVIFAVSKHSKYARKLGWEDLKYSIEDALALKWTLENKFGFKVTLYEDPTWEQMNLAMKKLQTQKWNPLDQLFIFYSGHGHKAPDGTGYLVPSNVGESIKTYYKMEYLRGQIDQIRCNNVVLT